ncbi:hypothetical protein [Rhodovulum marinum]|uniref:Uncharacterized protein n=1 Tax=Rhodovulum marinum TaxID=320662 RepID=A0A4R2QB30_9RHOB|nr:hypothetical protein [Rhodovulum marinum]TCP44111.1 hypothetical protein EV662_101198 [Rhodovulum marinum]
MITQLQDYTASLKEYAENLAPKMATSVDFLNENQDLLTLSLFFVTIIAGWLSGAFKALRQKPRLAIRTIDGPTFSCTFPTGRKHNNHDTHRTGVALYLNITNIGSAPTGISAIEVGYHWNLRPISLLWLKYRIGWFWLKDQTAALADFQCSIGESVKIFPFLTQRSSLSMSDTRTYLLIGEATNGVVYFEQSESWGGCFPKPQGSHTKIRLRIIDAFGRRHDSKHLIPTVTLEDAKKFNPRFGETHTELNRELPPSTEEEIEA